MTVTATADVVIGFQPRKPLEEVVDELLAGIIIVPPVDHVCRPTRWQQCSHDVRDRVSLLDRLAELSMPAQELMPAPDAPSMIRAAGGHTNQGGRDRASSPAPWAPAAAELLDEILRGALRAQREARMVLELDPLTVARVQVRHIRPRLQPTPIGPVHPPHQHCGHQSCGSAGLETIHVPADQVALAVAGRQALRGLPGMVRLLADMDHPLGVRIAGEREIRSQGKLEDRVRGWHQRALTMLGHQTELERIPQLPNPDHPWSQVSYYVDHGPVCESTWMCGHESCASIRWPVRMPGPRHGPVCASCAHGSCRRIRAAGRRWLVWRCPSCGADSLRRDPVTDLVHCLRSSCVDETGAGSSWRMADFETGSDDPWGDLA